MWVDPNWLAPREDQDPPPHPSGGSGPSPPHYPHCTDLHLWRTALVPDQQQVALSVYHNLLLEAATCNTRHATVNAANISLNWNHGQNSHIGLESYYDINFLGIYSMLINSSIYHPIPSDNLPPTLIIPSLFHSYLLVTLPACRTPSGSGEPVQTSRCVSSPGFPEIKTQIRSGEVETKFQ